MTIMIMTLKFKLKKILKNYKIMVLKKKKGRGPCPGCEITTKLEFIEFSPQHRYAFLSQVLAIRQVSRKANEEAQQTTLIFPYKALEFLPLGIVILFAFVHEFFPFSQ